jgi:hypothetical protein
MTTPIITLQRPWAYWVLLGLKSIETRTHSRFRSLVGQRIGIHAGQQWDDSALKIAGPYLGEQRLGQWRNAREYADLWEPGVICCTALVNDARPLTIQDERAAMIECKTPRYGLILSDIVPLAEPVPARGQQGIWQHDLLGAVAREIQQIFN